MQHTFGFVNHAFTSVNRAFTSVNQACTSVNQAFTSVNQAFTSLNQAFTSVNKVLGWNVNYACSTNIVMTINYDSSNVVYDRKNGQGTLTEREGSVQLTSSLRWVVLQKIKILFQY